MTAIIFSNLFNLDLYKRLLSPMLQFIAHATCQRQLISLWYSGLPWMRHQRVAVKLLAVPLATLLLPVCSLIFLIAPKTSVRHLLYNTVKTSPSSCCRVINYLTVLCIRDKISILGHVPLFLFTDTFPVTFMTSRFIYIYSLEKS